jgi:polar amino acid transport system substrate-binding protein
MMAWPPYFYLGDMGAAVGGDIELMQAIFKEAGCTLEIGEEVPRKRRLAMFMAGELDMIPGSSDTPERREYAWFSRPYRNETVSFFTLPAKLERYRDVRGFEDVLNRRITLLSLNSGWFGPEYEQYIGRLREAKLSSTFEGFAQGLVMLSKERGELIMADHATLLTEAARLKMDLAPLPINISHAPVHMMFNKKTVPEADVLQLNAAAERLEARGVLKSIRRNYGMQ